MAEVRMGLVATVFQTLKGRAKNGDSQIASRGIYLVEQDGTSHWFDSFGRYVGRLGAGKAMKIGEVWMEEIRKYARERHGPGCRIEFTAGWGCTIWEFYRRGEEYHAERVIW